MNDIKLGDFLKVTHTDTNSYCLCVTDMLFEKTGITFKEKNLHSITGIILESSLTFNLFKKRKLFFKSSIKDMKKITDKQKIEQLQIIYKLYLLQKS